MCSVCNNSVVNRGVGYQMTRLGCAGIGVYVRSIDLWVTSLSTRSGGGCSGSLASEISPASTDTMAICWTSLAYAALPQITTLSGHNYHL